MFEDISKVLLITDMDGTFLPASKQPSRENLAAIDRFMSAGGRFSVATGRSLQAMGQYFDTFSVNSPIIMCNGGMVYDIHSGEQIYDVYLPQSAAPLTERILRDNPDVGCEVLPIEGVYVPNMTEMEREHCAICKVTPRLCEVADIPKNWYKVLFAQHPQKMPALVEYVDGIKQDYPEIDFVISAPTYFEMLPTGISKGSALDEMKKRCGMEDFTVVAVGDYNNDIEMLAAADVGICPSNAAADVKAAADITLSVSCEENAIAHVVDYIFEHIKRRS